jgi:hypothetical protein
MRRMRRVARGVILLLTVVLLQACSGSTPTPPAGSAADPAPPATAPAATSPAESHVAEASGAKTSLVTVHYVADEGASIMLTLTESPDGSITGTMVEGDESMPVVGRREGTSLRGKVGPENDTAPFTATEEGDKLVFKVGPGDDLPLTFRRAEAPSAAAGASGR